MVASPATSSQRRARHRQTAKKDSRKFTRTEPVNESHSMNGQFWSAGGKRSTRPRWLALLLGSVRLMSHDFAQPTHSIINLNLGILVKPGNEPRQDGVERSCSRLAPRK